MASEERFAAYVRDQMRGAGDVSYRKMFGEYAVYLDSKVIALVCDNQLFAKPLAPVQALLGAVEEAPPYPGAKPHFLITEQLDDQELMAQMARVTADALPAPKPKKATAKKAAATKRASPSTPRKRS